MINSNKVLRSNSKSSCRILFLNPCRTTSPSFILKLTIAILGTFMITGAPVLAGKTKNQQNLEKAETADENFAEQLLKTEDPAEIKRLAKALTAPKIFEANFESTKKKNKFYELMDNVNQDIFLNIMKNINKNISQYILKPKKKLKLYENLHNSTNMTQTLSSDHMNEETTSIVLDSLLQRLSYKSSIDNYIEAFKKFAGKDLLFWGAPNIPQIMEQLELLKDEFKDYVTFNQNLGDLYATCLKGLEEPERTMQHWETLIETRLQGGVFNPRLIFSDISVGEETNPVRKTERTKVRTIVNNSCYFKDSDTNVIGAPLSLPNGSPIGYNIHLPLTDIKGILVQVYGGSRKTDAAYKPTPSSGFTQFLLQNGIVHVSLNLSDLLDLRVYQYKMPSWLHDSIHASINRFYEVITQEPETLDPSLTILKKQLPIVLYGQSFGGRTAVRHGELYPGTFTRYISHDGALSFRMIGLSDTEFASGRVAKALTLEEKDCAPAYLSPMLGMSFLQEPVLLLHNLDDNNVNIKVSLDFFQKAKKEGKDVSLFITEEGNILEENDEKNLHNKGHFSPDTMEYFIPYMNAIVNSLTNGPSSIPEISDWRAYQNNLYANKHYRSATFDERCIAEMFRLYKTALPFRAYKENAAQIVEKDKEETIWNEYYQPIFKSLYHFDYLTSHPGASEKELTRLKDKGLLTPEVLKKAAEHYFYESQKFIEEYYGLKIPDGLNQEKILQSVMPQFQQWVDEGFEGKHKYTNYILRSLYLANPELVDFDELYDKNERVLISKQALGLRRALIENIHENRRLAREAIRASMLVAAKRLPTRREEDRKAALLIFDSLVAPGDVDARNSYSSLIKTASRRHTEETMSLLKAKYESFIDALKEDRSDKKRLINWQFAKLSYTLLWEENTQNMEESFKDVYQSYGIKNLRSRTSALSADLNVLLDSMPAYSAKTKAGIAMRRRIDRWEFKEAWDN
ncbi:MAG TPA: prolyl oligopeptidase family serine peptidase [Alphaproteobacteria bacterium]|nr:prolyl oligopeptidase family serine peptidase [Alphaproteobacteria bacterium]